MFTDESGKYPRDRTQSSVTWQGLFTRFAGTMQYRLHTTSIRLGRAGLIIAIWLLSLITSDMYDESMISSMGPCHWFYKNISLLTLRSSDLFLENHLHPWRLYHSYNHPWMINTSMHACSVYLMESYDISRPHHRYILYII